jgi:hypothetical protein
VQDGGRAIVGNVTQHASVIVADSGAADTGADAGIAAGRESHRGNDGEHGAGA